MNRSKAKGTAWETTLVNWLRERLSDDRIERRALHGSVDLGDIYGLYAHGSVGVIEAKSYKSWGPHDLDVWKAQTLAERDNADADWGLLVPKHYGIGAKRLGLTPAYITHGDLERLANISYVPNAFSEHASDVWGCYSLEDVCRLIEGPGE